MLPILIIKILHLADAICVYIFVLPFHCWEPWHLYTICPSTKAAWCALFPHIDKEQFNEIWELFLVRGQCPISELAVHWSYPIHWPSFHCMLRYPFKAYIQIFDDIFVIPHPTFHSQSEWNPHTFMHAASLLNAIQFLCFITETEYADIDAKLCTGPMSHLLEMIFDFTCFKVSLKIFWQLGLTCLPFSSKWLSMT